MATEGRVELTSDELINLRSDYGDLLASIVDVLTIQEDERKSSKKELDEWLDRVWTNFANNVKLTDKPDFNFSEPIITKEPIDHTVLMEVKRAEQEIQLMIEKLIQTRKETTTIVKPLSNEIVTAESEATIHLQLEDSEPQKNLPIVDLEVTKEVEPVYKDTVELLSKLEITVPIVATDIEQFLPTAQDIKSLY